MTGRTLPGRPKWTRARVIAMVGALVLEGLIVWALVKGLAGNWIGEAESDPVLTAVDVRSPPPPEQPPEPVRKPAGSAAPAGPRTTAQVAPDVRIPLASPTPAAPASGSAAAGTGSGAGGTGSGSGAGGFGSGSGSGLASAPVRIAGALSDRDYPRDAGNAAGTVAIAFQVRPDGGVQGCTVLASSGSAALDRLTCALVERRFRYRPARDAAGRPAEATVRTTFTWGTRR